MSQLGKKLLAAAREGVAIARGGEWKLVWKTNITWHPVPRSRGLNNLGSSKRSGIRMKKRPVYNRTSTLTWVPRHEEPISEVGATT